MQPEQLPPKERALLDAARNNELVKVREMLLQGAVVDARDNLEMPWGQTPLMYAAQNGNTEMVHLLIDSGADVTVKDEAPPGEGGGQQPLHYAMRSKNLAVVEILLDAGDTLGARIIDTVDRFGGTPLTVAIDAGNQEAIQLLLRRGLDVRRKPRNKRFEPPLYAAVRNGNPEVVRLLLEAGAEVNAVNELGETPLYCAASREGEVASVIIEILLKASADVDHADNSGGTPLFSALLHRNGKAIRSLANAGANVNRVINNQNGTLLDVAEKRMNTAKMTLRDNSEPAWAHEKSKASYAAWKEVFDLLLELGAKRKSEL